MPVHRTDSYATLMSPNKGQTAVHGCHCLDDMAVRMREVLARPWVGVSVPLALNLSYYGMCMTGLVYGTFHLAFPSVL